jgi:hypothetical protein
MPSSPRRGLNKPQKEKGEKGTGYFLRSQDAEDTQRT